MVWGGRRLHDVLHKPLDLQTTYGESWEVSDHPLHESVVATGPLAEKTLRHLMEQDRPGLLGCAASRYEKFPWLIKFLDANDWLSVQVHPDERAVAKLWPGEGSKTEAWFIIDAAPGSRIYAGLRPGVDEKRFREALAAGKVTECLHHFEPRAGDCVFLPTGTVHAVGGGVLIAEIQQTSDATFRLYDWNRVDAQGKRRLLHIEESLASIHWDQGSVQPIHAGKFKDDLEGSDRQILVGCPYFQLELLQTHKTPRLGGANRLQALIILGGHGRWVNEVPVSVPALGTDSPRSGGGHGFADAVKLGEVWVLPASLPLIECKPEPVLNALLCTLP